MKIKAGILVVALLFTAQGRAVGPFIVVGDVLSSVNTPGSATTSNSFANITLMRHSLIGEAAHQIAGPDPAFPAKIFPAGAGAPARFIVDAGTQWSTPATVNWTILSVAETAVGQYGWTGDAYVAAGTGVISSIDFNMSRTILSPIYMGRVPTAVLDWAGNTVISLKLGHFPDVGGQAINLALFRRDFGTSNYAWLTDVALPAAGQVTAFMDLSVTANALYDYAVGVNFNWPGGGGEGSLPARNGIYSSLARSFSGPFAASAIQPTPTPPPSVVPEPEPVFEVPDGWLAYPNPASGKNLWVAIKAENKGTFVIHGFNLVGERTITHTGVLERGLNKVLVPISKFASGVYFLRVETDEEGMGTRMLRWRKIAIVH